VCTPAVCIAAIIFAAPTHYSAIYPLYRLHTDFFLEHAPKHVSLYIRKKNCKENGWSTARSKATEQKEEKSKQTVQRLTFANLPGSVWIPIGRSSVERQPAKCRGTSDREPGLNENVLHKNGLCVARPPKIHSLFLVSSTSSFL
jgi:hypothetical protein